MARKKLTWKPYQPGEYEFAVASFELAKGEFPTLSHIAGGLRGDEPVPRPVRDFFIKLIENNKIKRLGKGSPRKRDSFQEKIEQDYIRHTHQFHLANAQNGYVQKGRPNDDYLSGTPWEIALELTTDDWLAQIGRRRVSEADRDKALAWIKGELRKARNNSSDRSKSFTSEDKTAKGRVKRNAVNK